MVFVGVLIKRQKNVRLIACAEDLTRTDAHLENGRAAGNRGGNCHESHDLLLAPPGQARKETADRSEEHTSELQSQSNLVCRLLLEKKKKKIKKNTSHVKT